MLNFTKIDKIGKTVLVVEDDKSLRTAIKKKLVREGFDMLEAGNGLKGLKLALESKPDMILLDIVMPVMDGAKMLKELRKDEWGRDAKVIILTNLSDPDSELESFQEGVNDYLVKSDWKIEDLMKKIKEKLNIKYD